MRKKILAGNWKMNPNFQEAHDLLLGINTVAINNSPKCTIVVAPPYLYLREADTVYQNNKVFIAAQNVSSHENGAYTGEISASMLASLAVEYCIVGHSERRQYHHETDEEIKQKVDILLAHKLEPIYCCGETEQERKSGRTLNVIKNQIDTALLHLGPEEIKRVVIAYEPVWAIGTGNVATPDQAQEVHEYIRNYLGEKYTGDIANSISILYGGSVNPSNAAEIFAKPDIDGGLIGGASLKSADFGTLIQILDRS